MWLPVTKNVKMTSNLSFVECLYEICAFVMFSHWDFDYYISNFLTELSYLHVTFIIHSIYWFAYLIHYTFIVDSLNILVNQYWWKFLYTVIHMVAFMPTWCNHTVSGLTMTWHYCCYHKLLLLLRVDRVASAESHPAWNKAVVLDVT